MTSEFLGVIGFGFLSALVLWIGWRRGFFNFPQTENWIFPVRWHHVVTVFAIYFAGVSVGVPILSSLLKRSAFSVSLVSMASWLNFLTSTLIVFLIAIYSLFLPRVVPQKIWRRDAAPSYVQDLHFAAMAWLISFPLVIFLNQLLDFVLHAGFNLQELPDQLAVRFLKMTFQDPLNFFMTVITIVVLAPILEETLFRGFLQSFIRQHLGSKNSILITALCFSFFHYSPEQGLANISIIGSLFALALFLGFVYDRRGSLAASMALHASFNAVNVLNLYFLGGFPKGPV